MRSKLNQNKFLKNQNDSLLEVSQNIEILILIHFGT